VRDAPWTFAQLDELYRRVLDEGEQPGRVGREVGIGLHAYELVRRERARRSDARRV
jgi:hypothetical protein